MDIAQDVETRKARITEAGTGRTETEVQRDIDSTGSIPFSGRGRTPPARLTPQQVLYLQRTVGNRATLQLLQNQRTSYPTTGSPMTGSPMTGFPTTGSPATRPEVQRISQGAQPGVIQRKKGYHNKSKGIKPDTQGVNPKDVGGDFYRLSLGVMIGDKDYLLKSTKFYIYKLFNSLKPKRFRKSREEVNAKAPKETGHSWVELTHYHEGAVQNFHSFGFMPKGSGTGEVVSPDPNSMKEPTGGFMQDFNLTAQQYNNALARARELQKTAKQYNLYGFNCTAFAKAIVNAAGFSFAGMRVSPGARIGPGSAFTPNRLRNALKSKAAKGKALTHLQMKGRMQSELKARQQLANQSPITLIGPLNLYHADETLYDTYEAENTLDRIEKAQPDVPGEREVVTPGGIWWVKQKELEAALGYPLTDAEYTTMQQVIAAAQSLAPTTTTQDFDPSGVDDPGSSIGELTGQTPEELLENVDPQTIEVESEEQL